jgi:23S rRNA (pseudouridine1915-N3)-methyltransferase
MMHITICAVGALKDPSFLVLARELYKRLSPYARVAVEEVQAEKFLNESDRIKAVRKEGDRIVRLLERKDGAYIIVMDEAGKEFTSREFAVFLEKQTSGGQELVFVIGGALGLDERVRTMARTTIALSKMTFVHEMARVILLEQIYRAGTITQGKTYHY